MTENRKRFRSEENYFDRLPKDLITSIFDRIRDVKCLCICYSVCKDFAAHVVQTRSVSVEIPYALIGHDLPIWPPGVLSFVKKLGCIESAAIEFLPPRTNQQPNLVWWKYDSSDHSFIFLFAEIHGDGITSAKATRKFTRGSVWFSSIEGDLLDFRLKFGYVEELVALIPNLKHISATDSMKQGSIVIEEQGIVSMKNNIDYNDGELCIKNWVARKVKLPFSGGVMKNVVLICVGLTAENLREEVNHEYREVALTMMKKPPSCTQFTGKGRCTIPHLLCFSLQVQILMGYYA